ncbi:MAG: hypothetical protein WCS99_16460, partial [Limisphaerales bacterium]
MRAFLALGLSLALSGVLLAMNCALFKSHGGLPGFGAERKTVVITRHVVHQPAPAPAPVTVTNAPPFHWSALESPDYIRYADNLRTVGCPERTLRDILLPDIEKLFDERAREITKTGGDTFWETADQRDARQRQREAKLRALELEKRALVQQLLGMELSHAALKELRSEGFASAILQILLGFTDTSKSDHLFTVHQLRADDAKALITATEGILLDEDLPRLQALRERFESELARGLAADELEELRLRLACLVGGNRITRRNGVNVTGTELREICRLRADT